MRILLIFPETTIFEDPMVFPPLGLFYLRAVLEEQGHEVAYVDMSEYDVVDGTRIKRRINPPATGYDVYLVSGTSPQSREIRRIGAYLRERGCVTVVGGPHVTNYAGPLTVPGRAPSGESSALVDEDLLRYYHVLVKREGEVAVLKALDRLHEAGEHMAKHGRGIVIQEPNIPDLGTLPIPNREAALLYHYFLEDGRGRKRPATTLFSSRGCPERCAFCDSPALWGRAVRYVPIPTVVRELTQIKELGFDGIHFFDDILPLARPRMVELCKHLKSFDFTWRCFVRVDIMTHAKYGKAFMGMMYEHGCREVLVGVESGDQRILDVIHKGTTVEQNTIVRQWCREIGIRFKASVILGLPGEDRASMEATLRWVLENRPDRVNICTYIPFPGTPISKGAELERISEYGRDAVHAYDIKMEIDTALLDGDYFYAGSRDKLQVVTSTSVPDPRGDPGVLAVRLRARRGGRYPVLRTFATQRQRPLFYPTWSRHLCPARVHDDWLMAQVEGVGRFRGARCRLPAHEEVVQAPLGNEVFFSGSCESGAAEADDDFPISEVVGLLLMHAALGIHIQPRPQEAIVEADKPVD